MEKEDRDKAKIRATTLNNLTSNVANGNKGAMQKLTSFDPDSANKILDAYGKMDENKRKVFKENIDTVGRMSAYVLNSEDPEKSYALMRQNLAPEITANMPEQYDPNFVKLRLAQAREVDDMMKTPDKVNFGGNDVLYKDGQIVGSTQSQARTNILNTNNQNEIGRDFKTSEREAGQSFKASESQKGRDFRGSEGDKNRAVRVSTNNSTNATLSGIARLDRQSFEKMQNRVPASKKTKNDMQKNIVGAEKALIGLQSVADNFKEEYLTYEGRAKSTVGGGIDKLGKGPVGNFAWGVGEFLTGDDLSNFNAKRTKLMNSAKQFFNQYRKEITGAAASEKELKDLEASMFNVNQGPEEFKASFDNFINKMGKEIEAQKNTLVNGVDVGETQTPSLKASPASDLGMMSDDDLDAEIKRLQGGQ